MTPSTPMAVSPVNVLRLGRALVHKLYVCLKTSSMYDPSNVAVQEAAREVVLTVRSICHLDGCATLGQAYDFLTLNGNRLRPDVTGVGSFHYLTELLTTHDVGELRLEELVTPHEIVQLCAAIQQAPRGADDSYRQLARRLVESGIDHVQLSEKQALPSEVDDQQLKRNVKERSVQSFFKSIGLTRRILSASDPTRIDFRRAKRVVQSMVDAISEEEFILLSLASIKNYDQYTFNHSTNVAVYSVTFGQRLGLDRHLLTDLGMAGLFHDLGKTRVPKEILNKTTVLEEEEWEVMKGHSVLGAEILLKSRKLNDSVIRNILVAFEHHLNADLGGYPHLSDRRELNLFSKIVAIADCYDALTTPRVYRNLSYTPQEALSIMMEGRGTLYDPTLLKVFVNCIGIHPIGSIVELSSGERAVVYRSNPAHVDRPIVKIFANASGDRVAERVEDLSREKPGTEPLRILRTIDPGNYFESIEDYLGIL